MLPEADADGQTDGISTGLMELAAAALKAQAGSSPQPWQQQQQLSMAAKAQATAQQMLGLEYHQLSRSGAAASPAVAANGRCATGLRARAQSCELVTRMA